MLRYVCKRILSAIPILFGITVIIYFLLSFVPGSALDVLRSSDLAVSSADYEALRHTLGLDQPVYVRYLLWLRDLFHGDLGNSYRYAAPVTEIIRQRIGPSVILSGTGVVCAVLLALPIGTMAAYKPYSVWDRLSSFFALVGATLPRFFVCIVFIYFFAFRLNLVPTMGMHSAGNTTFGDLVYHLVLPASIITLGTMGSLIKQTRSACLEVFHEDYLKTARSKGISEAAVVVKHGFRTAMTPIVTQILLEIPGIIGGSTITEKIFGWPGIGSLMIDAISNRDYPLVMGVALLIAVTVLVTNILLDIVYGLLDPRVSYS